MSYRYKRGDVIRLPNGHRGKIKALTEIERIGRNVMGGDMMERFTFVHGKRVVWSSHHGCFVRINPPVPEIEVYFLPAYRVLDMVTGKTITVTERDITLRRKFNRFEAIMPVLQPAICILIILISLFLPHQVTGTPLVAGMVSQFSSGAINVSNSTAYLGIQTDNTSAGWQTTRTRTEQVMPCAAVLDYLRVQCSVAPSSGQSRAFALMLGSTAQSLTATIADTNLLAQDLTHASAYSAADLITMRQVSSATVNSAVCWWAVRITTTNPNEFPIMWNNATGITSGATTYAPIQGDGVTGTEANLQVPMPIAGTATKIYAHLDANAATSSVDFTLYVNGSASALTCSIASGSAAANGTASVAINIGDRVTFEIKNNGTGTGRPAISILFAPTIDGRSCLLAPGNQTQSQSLTRINNFGGAQNTWVTGGNENTRQTPLIACTLGVLTTYTQGPLNNNQTDAYTVRINGSGTAITKTATGDGSNPIATNDTDHTVDVQDDQLLSLQCITGAGATARQAAGLEIIMDTNVRLHYRTFAVRRM